MLKIGDKAPLDIELESTTGTNQTLKDYLGAYLVIYFYPKDDTPGCTTEACELRDFNSDIQQLGANILGISKDTIRKHKKFIEKFSLPFPLLSDPEAKLMQAFGTWQEKKFMGRTYMGTLRSTFIIDPKGKIAHVWEEVKPLGHGKEVLQTLFTLMQK